MLELYLTKKMVDKYSKKVVFEFCFLKNFFLQINDLNINNGLYKVKDKIDFKSNIK